MNLGLELGAVHLLRLLAALVIGAIIGGEREYRSKAAGAGAPDRIAANIVTGIGFLGAGAIFKDGMTVSGLTTATSIWVTAALGMAAGGGELALAGAGLGLAMVVLILFEWLQNLIDRVYQKRSYRFQFPSARLSQREVDKMLGRFPVSFTLGKSYAKRGS